jgi:hypothetical protein
VYNRDIYGTEEVSGENRQLGQIQGGRLQIGLGFHINFFKKKFKRTPSRVCLDEFGFDIGIGGSNMI